MKKSKSKPKPTKKKAVVRKTQKKKSIRKAKAKPEPDLIEEDDDIAEAKIQRSIGQEDDYIDRQIHDDEDEDEDDYAGEDYGTGNNY